MKDKIVAVMFAITFAVIISGTVAAANPTNTSTNNTIQQNITHIPSNNQAAHSNSTSVNNNTKHSANSDPVYVATIGSDSNSGTQTSPYLTIGKGISSVSSGGIVYVANGIYSGIGNSNLTINQDLTIIGASQSGTIIDGGGVNGIFSINPGFIVTLEDLTLQNGNTTNGGAIYNQGNLTILNCTFKNNYATVFDDNPNTGQGGAIYNNGNSTTAIVNITNSVFTGNSANGNGGGAVFNSGSPGNATMNINNSTFTNNICTDFDGGAIFNSGYLGNATVNINNSLFNNNTAASNGGAIDNNAGSLNITKSTLNNNTAKEGLFGGAINNEENGTSYLNNCTLDNNTSSNGGATSNSGGEVTINNSTFTGNTATGSGGAVVNALYQSTTNIENSIFTDNQAIDGGAIANDGYPFVNNTMNIINCTFSSNTANYGGAISISGNSGTSTVNITECTLTNNDATDSGGAVYNNAEYSMYGTGSATVIMQFNRIVGNTASIGNAIYSADSGVVNATLNWWGSNSGSFIASQTGTDATGIVTYNPWIVLTIIANPQTVGFGGTSTITADLLYDSNGVYHNPTSGVVPYSGIIKFKTTNGTIGNATMSNGVATSTLANLGLNPAIVSATLDNQTVSTIINRTPIIKLINGIINTILSILHLI